MTVPTRPRRPQPPATTVAPAAGTATVSVDCGGATVVMSGWPDGTYVELSLDGHPFLAVTASSSWGWPDKVGLGEHSWATITPDGVFTNGVLSCGVTQAPTTTTTSAPATTTAATTTTTPPVLETAAITVEPTATSAAVRQLPQTGANDAPVAASASVALLVGVALAVLARRRPVTR